MRHASIQTTMNIYGKAMTDSKRQAHSKVVEMVLKLPMTPQTAGGKTGLSLLGSKGGLGSALGSLQLIDLIGCGGRI